MVDALSVGLGGNGDGGMRFRSTDTGDLREDEHISFPGVFPCADGRDYPLLSPVEERRERISFSCSQALVPRSTLFCGSESTKRAKTALQPLEIVHYSLRAAPCLDAPGEL
uniref:Uncharacterized protein n=1 Tax=Candidatus Kentrum sp. DK TaxID=2126562 RepID=A0A450TJB3_9GAMM|nr:MAG: hypothetical protein BECKDK2373B_GA0170837_11917 [Candidatus Kentron sp. DK]